MTRYISEREGKAMPPAAKAKLAAVFGAGFVSFLGQGLVFRSFLGVFEGGELSTGLFFALWLLWICAGAVLGSFLRRFCESIASFFPLAILAYLPAIALQLWLTANARELAGVAAFAAFPFAKLLLWTALACAPASLLTGFLFVAAGLWLKESKAPVAWVYSFETLGSCAGAFASTLLLSEGLGDAVCLSVSASLLALLSAVSIKLESRKELWRLAAPFSLIIGSLLFMALGGGKALDSWLDARAFRNVVPDASFKGSFSTRQAKYLYGEREGQTLVVAWGSVIETLPGRESSLESAALALSQNPEARRILAFGNNSLSLCLRLSEIPNVSELTWSSCDPEYPTELQSALPGFFQSQAARKIKALKGDLRQFLMTERCLDLAVIGSVNHASLSSIRFTTKEFFETVKASLSDGGMMLFSFPGGENFLGGELARLGASFYFTAKNVFPKVLLKPGDSSLLVASSEKGSPSDNADELIKRLYTIKSLSSECHPEQMRTLFDPERIRFQRDLYEGVFKNRKELNSDLRPSSFPSAMLLSAAKSGAKLDSSRSLLLALAALPLLLLACFAVFRSLWLLMNKEKSKTYFPASPFDIKLLIFASAAWSMGMLVALMFKYQVAEGSLFVDFGLLNALFMLGSFFGGMGALHPPRRKGVNSLCIAFAAFLMFSLQAAVSNPANSLPHLKTFLAGLLGGFVVSACAKELAWGREETGKAAASVEWLDCLGGALGAFITSIAAIPLLGLQAATVCAGPLPVLAALPFSCSAFRRPEPPEKAWPPLKRRLKAGVYVLCGGLFALILASILPLAKPIIEIPSFDLAALALIFVAGAVEMAAVEFMAFERRRFMAMALAAALLYALSALALLHAWLPAGAAQAPAPLPPLKSLEQLQGAAIVAPAEEEQEGPRGKPAKVDAAKLKELVKAGRLSSRKALYWSGAGE